MKNDLAEHWRVIKRVAPKDGDLLYFAPPYWGIRIVDYLRAGKFIRSFYLLNGYVLFIIAGGFTLLLPAGIIGNSLNGNTRNALVLLFGVPIWIFMLWLAALLITGIGWMHRHWSDQRRANRNRS